MRMGTACWLLRNISPVSALAVDTMTVRMVCHLVMIGPIGVGVVQMGGGGGVSLRY